MRITDGQLQLAATDLSNFLACRHLTRLDTLKSQGHLSPAKQFDIGFQDLIKRGEATRSGCSTFAEEGRSHRDPDRSRDHRRGKIEADGRRDDGWS